MHPVEFDPRRLGEPLSLRQCPTGRIRLTHYPRCDRTTRGSAIGYCDIAPLGGYLQFRQVEFPRDAHGNETGWVVRGEEALCPDHANSP